MTVKNILSFLEENGLTIAFAESMTGGYAAYNLIKNPGASKVLKSSLIVYSNESKKDFLGITLEEIKKYSVVSEYIAIRMAREVMEKCHSDLGIAITGNAGPTLQADTEDYEACIGIVYDDQEYSYRYSLFNLSRDHAIKKTVEYLYEKLGEILL